MSKVSIVSSISAYEWTCVPDILIYHQKSVDYRSYDLYRVNVSTELKQPTSELLANVSEGGVVVLAQDCSGKMILGLNDEIPE